jgi:hypothetical protein
MDYRTTNLFRACYLSAIGLGLLIASLSQLGCHHFPMSGEGGGQDALTIELPFESGYQSRCVQGAGGSYSHSYDSTLYDVDLDTPNNVDDLVFAPVGGTAYVHDENRKSGFGVHVNIDQGDYTYVIMGHLDDVLIGDGEEVAAGQLIAVEGTTGNSTGDHVHLGRHQGDASEDASWGDSVEGLIIHADDLSGDGSSDYLTSDMDCDLSTGHIFESENQTPKWHPDGTLIMVPGQSTVYLLQDGEARPFLNEDSFWSRGYDFQDLSLVSQSELNCFPQGEEIAGSASIRAVYEAGTVWLLLDNIEASDQIRYQVRSIGWQAVLKSYGVIAATYDDLQSPSAAGVDLDDYPVATSTAVFRDGTLLKETEQSTVYVVSNGTAQPIVDWDTFLRLDFYTRSIIEVDPGVVSGVQGQVGDCSADAYCLTSADLYACGGSGDDYGSSYSATGGRDDESVIEEDTGHGTSETQETTQNSSSSSSTGDLHVSWEAPSSRQFDRITLSGEYTSADGSVSGWRDLAEVTDDDQIEYRVEDANSGDRLRFSVEFENSSGSRSWSCLAPYPPGTVQGTPSATFGDSSLTVTPADDPSSDGCGLVVEIP